MDSAVASVNSAPNVNALIMLRNQEGGYHAYAYFAKRQDNLAKSQQLVRPGKEVEVEVISRSTYGGGKSK